MLKRAIKAEQMKLRHSVIWIACLVMPIIAVCMGTFNYLQCLDQLKNGWYSLWTQHTIFYCYFCFPTLIGIYGAYLCRLEHMGDNWKNLLSAPIPISHLYWAKLVTVFKLALVTQLWLGVLFFISGKLAGITTPFPVEFMRWMGCGLLGSLSMVSVQLLFSIIIRNFALPVGIALIGGIGGLVARACGLGLCFPYSLFSIGMCANDPKGAMQCSVITFIVVCLIQMVVLSLIGMKCMKRCPV